MQGQLDLDLYYSGLVEVHLRTIGDMNPDFVMCIVAATAYSNAGK
jgi:hypothetical protein